MERAEFDKFAEEYRQLHTKNIRASGESPEFFAEYKVQDLAVTLTRTERVSGKILDFGSGVGTSVPYFHKLLPRFAVTCIDVSAKSIDIGESRFQGQAEFLCFDGRNIPFPDGSFDVTFAACVFHHIDHAEHVTLLSELRRVLAPGGLICIFEHNPLNPLTVHAVNTCPFDENARLIRAGEMAGRLRQAGFAEPLVRYRLFFPGPLRRLRQLERALAWCPIGAQYSVMAKR